MTPPQALFLVSFIASLTAWFIEHLVFMIPKPLFLVSFIAFVTIFSILNCFFDRSNDLRAAEALL